MLSVLILSLLLITLELSTPPKCYNTHAKMLCNDAEGGTYEKDHSLFMVR